MCLNFFKDFFIQKNQIHIIIIHKIQIHIIPIFCENCGMFHHLQRGISGYASKYFFQARRIYPESISNIQNISSHIFGIVLYSMRRLSQISHSFHEKPFCSNICFPVTDWVVIFKLLKHQSDGGFISTIFRIFHVYLHFFTPSKCAWTSSLENSRKAYVWVINFIYFN